MEGNLDDVESYDEGESLYLDLTPVLDLDHLDLLDHFDSCYHFRFLFLLDFLVLDHDLHADLDPLVLDPQNSQMRLSASGPEEAHQ